MGDIKRKPNRYSKPRKSFDSVRIAEENVLVKKYGLKNKKEIWKASAKVSTLRKRAKELIPKTEEEKNVFFNKLKMMGFDVEDIADVLALETSNWLDRRLQTILVKKGLSNTPQGARQLITHKKVLVDGKIVNIPSFFVTRDLESKIIVKAVVKKAKKVEEKTTGEATEEVPTEEEKTERKTE